MKLTANVKFNDLSPRDQVFLRNAANTATLSRDSETKHGVLLVLDRNVVATGYNSFPAGADDANLPTTRPDKYPYIVHAETNAICNAARRGVSIEGATAYCTGESCLECLKQLLQCGVRKFVVGNRGHSKKNEQADHIEYFLNWYKCKVTKVTDFPDSLGTITFEGTRPTPPQTTSDKKIISGDFVTEYNKLKDGSLFMLVTISTFNRYSYVKIDSDYFESLDGTNSRSNTQQLHTLDKSGLFYMEYNTVG